MKNEQTPSLRVTGQSAEEGRFLYFETSIQNIFFIFFHHVQMKVRENGFVKRYIIWYNYKMPLMVPDGPCMRMHAKIV